MCIGSNQRPSGVVAAAFRTQNHDDTSPVSSPTYSRSKTSVLGESIVTRNIAIFERETQTFRTTANMIDQRVLHTATRLADGRVLFLGGADDANVIQATGEIYDPVADAWTARGG